MVPGKTANFTAMANLSIQISDGVSGFFRWWGGEMAAFLPARLRARLERGGQRLTVEISDQRALFGLEKGREARALGEVTVSPAGLAGQRDAGQHDAVSRIVRGAGVRSAEVVLRLPRDKVLRRLVDLPAAAAENQSTPGSPPPPLAAPSRRPSPAAGAPPSGSRAQPGGSPPAQPPCGSRSWYRRRSRARRLP